MTVTTLRATGVIDSHADAAIVAAGRTLADMVDLEVTSPDCRPGTVRYLTDGLVAVVGLLRAGRETTNSDADAFGSFLADIHAPSVSDSQEP